ncbi:hypothetical protein PC123_g11608 [Phytophthora cactorum]|nr:hypothetical protein PC123_g11608 [Phytophthora cactorum]
MACVEEALRKSKVPEWMTLCQSWNVFVENFNKDAKAYRAHITAAGIPCAIPFGTACLHCLPGAVRLSERDVTGYTTVRVPVQLRDLRAQLERRDECRDTPSVSGDRSARAGVTPALRSGLRTPSPFPERPPSERSEVPMYLGGEEILSNEYEDEPDLGSSLGVHSPRFARLSTESSRAHRAVVAAGAERYPSYGQPQVDRDSRALYDPVAALEQFQSEEFAQLQQELRYQKAQIAQAAQTASNIQVELGTQVGRLHDRVAASRSWLTPLRRLLRAIKVRWLVLRVRLQPHDIECRMEPHAGRYVHRVRVATPFKHCERTDEARSKLACLLRNQQLHVVAGSE